MASTGSGWLPHLHTQHPCALKGRCGGGGGDSVTPPYRDPSLEPRHKLLFLSHWLDKSRDSSNCKGSCKVESLFWENLRALNMKGFYCQGKRRKEKEIWGNK